jgi:ATP-dependent DNA helicase RecG
MLADALNYIQSQFIAEKIRKFPNRMAAERSFNYPMTALREALTNAVYHRSYEVREPVEVRILPDRITILSHPGPDRSILDENMKTYNMVARRYRNRRIGEFLKELDMTEGRNTGVPKILRAVQANKSPVPSFLTDPDRTWFIAEFPIHPEFAADAVVASVQDETTGKRAGKGSGKGSGKTSVKTSVKASVKTSVRIIERMRETPEITLEELANVIGVTQRSIERNIVRLKANGIIARIGGRKEGHWEVRQEN